MAKKPLQKPRNKQLAKLDARPELTIGEPILASSWVTPRHPIRGRLLGNLAGAALDGFTSPTPLLALAEAGTEAGWDFAKDKLYAPKEIRLRPEMYLVVGPTTCALYEIDNSMLTPAIGKTLLYLPRRAVAGLDLDAGPGKRPRLLRKLTLRLADDRAIELCDRRLMAQGATEGVRDELQRRALPAGSVTASASGAAALSATEIEARDKRARRVLGSAMGVAAATGLVAGAGLWLPWCSASLTGTGLPEIDAQRSYDIFALYAGSPGFGAAIPWVLAACALLIVLLGAILAAVPKARSQVLYTAQGIGAWLAVILSLGALKGLDQAGGRVAAEIASRHPELDPHTILQIQGALGVEPGVGAFVTAFAFGVAGCAILVVQQYFDQAKKAREALAKAATRTW